MGVGSKETYESALDEPSGAARDSTSSASNHAIAVYLQEESSPREIGGNLLIIQYESIALGMGEN